MKQHITFDDIETLSGEAENRFYQYAELKGWDDSYWSIGQMIEFLDEHRKRDWAICFGKNLAFVESSVGLLGKTPKNPDGELCDGLWEAVKQVLEVQ